MKRSCLTVTQNLCPTPFKVISAQQLPKPEWDKPSSIVDPWVWVETHGVPIDNNKEKTHRIDNNGKHRPNVRRHIRMKMGAETCMGVSSQNFRFMKECGERICVPSAHFRTYAYAMFLAVIGRHRVTERQRESVCTLNN